MKRVSCAQGGFLGKSQVLKMKLKGIFGLLAGVLPLLSGIFHIKRGETNMSVFGFERHKGREWVEGE